MMKALPVVMFLFLSTALVSQTEASSSGLGATGTGFEVRNSASTDLNLRNIENKMADSLHSLSLIKQGERKNALINDPAAGLSNNNQLANGTGLNNSSQNNSSVDNESLINSSAINQSEQKTALNRNPGADGKGMKSALSSGDGAPGGMGASSSGKYSGLYGVEASRHEMGKSDIKSKMVLSGGFEVDKTVQFQDHNF